jgi:uncharacterized membrane protein
MSLDLLLDLGLPGIVFLGLCFWLVRRTVRAARTERDLERQRPQLAAVAAAPPRPPVPSADVRGANPAHVRIVEEIAREAAQGSPAGAPTVEVLWIRSNASHAVWCERRTPGGGTVREVICVARIESGAVVERWSFG